MKVLAYSDQICYWYLYVRYVTGILVVSESDTSWKCVKLSAIRNKVSHKKQGPSFELWEPPLEFVGPPLDPISIDEVLRCFWAPW